MPPNFYLYEILWWTLATLAMSLVGLWSIWGGLGRPNWFLRVAVVLGWISLVLLIPAFELLIMFLIQAGVVVVVLSVWRTWQLSRRLRSVTAESGSQGVPRSPWQVLDPRSHAAGGHRGLALGDADPRARGGLGGMAHPAGPRRNCSVLHAGRSLDRIEQSPVVDAATAVLPRVSIRFDRRVACAGAVGRVRSPKIASDLLADVGFASCFGSD